jgi:hypothetical protein
LRNGLVAAALIVPVFMFRHYVQDGGRFPTTQGESGYEAYDRVVEPRAGLKPYLALALFTGLIIVTAFFAVLPERELTISADLNSRIRDCDTGRLNCSVSRQSIQHLNG